MSNNRKNIRSAIKNLLIGSSPTYNTQAQNRVYTNLTHNKKILPCIVIYDEQENASPLDINGTRYIRTVTTKIEATIEANSNYDDNLDDFVTEIENIIKSNKTLNGTANACLYINTEIKYEAGEKKIGQATLTYEIKYVS